MPLQAAKVSKAKEEREEERGYSGRERTKEQKWQDSRKNLPPVRCSALKNAFSWQSE